MAWIRRRPDWPGRSDICIHEKSCLLPGHAQGQLSSCALSEDGSVLAVPAWSNGRTTFWHTQSGRELGGGLACRTNVSSCAFYRDMFAAVSTATVQMYRLFDGPAMVVDVPAGLADPAISCAFSCGQATYCAYVPMWKVTHMSAWDCVFSPDGQVLVLASYSRVRLVRSVDGVQVGVLDVGATLANRVQFSPDGRLIAAVLQDGSTVLWCAATFELLHTLHTRNALPENVLTMHVPADTRTVPANTCGFSLDSLTLAVGADDGSVAVWCCGSGALMWYVAGHENIVACCVFCPDGLVTVSWDNTVKLWQPDTGACLHGFEVSAYGTHVSCGEVASGVMAVGSSRAVHVWHVWPTHRAVLLLAAHESRRRSAHRQQLPPEVWSSVLRTSRRATQPTQYGVRRHADEPPGDVVLFG